MAERVESSFSSERTPVPPSQLANSSSRNGYTAAAGAGNARESSPLQQQQAANLTAATALPAAVAVVDGHHCGEEGGGGGGDGGDGDGGVSSRLRDSPSGDFISSSSNSSTSSNNNNNTSGGAKNCGTGCNNAVAAEASTAAGATSSTTPTSTTTISPAAAATATTTTIAVSAHTNHAAGTDASTRGTTTAAATTTGAAAAAAAATTTNLPSTATTVQQSTTATATKTGSTAADSRNSNNSSGGCVDGTGVVTTTGSPVVVSSGNIISSSSSSSSSYSSTSNTLRAEAAGWIPSEHAQQNGLLLSGGGGDSSSSSTSPNSSSSAVPSSPPSVPTVAGASSIPATIPKSTLQATPPMAAPATTSLATATTTPTATPTTPPRSNSSPTQLVPPAPSSISHTNNGGSGSGQGGGRVPRGGTHPRYHQGGVGTGGGGGGSGGGGYHQGSGGKFAGSHDGSGGPGGVGNSSHNRQQQQHNPRQHPPHPQHPPPPPQPPPPQQQQQQGGLYCPPGALGPYVMDAAGQQVLYVQVGETVYFQMGDTVQCIPGPATVRMVTGGGAGVALPPVVAIPQPAYDEMLQFHRPPQFITMHPHAHPPPPPPPPATAPPPQVASIPSAQHHSSHHGHGPHIAPPFMASPLPGAHQLATLPPPGPPSQQPPHQIPHVPHQTPVSVPPPYESAAGQGVGAGTPHGSPHSPAVSYASSASSGGSGSSPAVCSIEPQQQTAQQQQQQQQQQQTSQQKQQQQVQAQGQPAPTSTQVPTPAAAAGCGSTAAVVQQRQSPLLQTPTQAALSHSGVVPALPVLTKNPAGQGQPGLQGQQQQQGGHRWDGGYHPHHIASGGRAPPRQQQQQQQQQHMHQHLQHQGDSNSLHPSQDGAMMNGVGNRDRGGRGGPSPHGGSHGHDDGLRQPGMMHHGQQGHTRYARPAQSFGDERSHRQHMKLRKKLEQRTPAASGGVTLGTFHSRGQKDDASNNNSNNNNNKCNGGIGIGVSDSNNATSQAQQHHQQHNSNTHTATTTSICHSNNSNNSGVGNNGHHHQPHYFQQNQHQHQMANNGSSNVGGIQQAVTLTAAATAAASNAGGRNSKGSSSNNSSSSLMTSNNNNNLSGRYSLSTASSTPTVTAGHGTAAAADCNQNSLMPNSVILGGTGVSLDKEIVRGAPKGGGGHKGRGGAPGQSTAGGAGDDISPTYENNSSNNNSQANKKSNPKVSAEMELRELLTCVTAPVAVDVHARSALLTWSAPDPSGSRMGQHNFNAINVAAVIPELSYELYVSLAPGEKNNAGARERERVRQVAAGRVREFRLEGLAPATDYQVAVQAVSDKIKGTPSTPCVFETLKCEPNTPQPPKLVSRTKNTLELKWLSTPDNGAKVIEYVLFMTELKLSASASCPASATQDSQEGSGGDAAQERHEEQQEVYRGPNKNFKVSRLAQNTTYQFRVGAVNSVGNSELSQPACYSTCGAAPPRPEPPQLVRLGSDFIELRWDARNSETYGLYMVQDGTAHGFVATFNGKEGQYRASDLCRSTKYCFKLNAQNEDGTSVFSNVVTYETRAEVPGKPGRPSPTSKVAPRQCVLSWSPPGDSGGAPVQGYCLEMCPVARNQQGSQPPSEFQLVYTGIDHRTLVGNLQPGSTYRFRVSCYSEAGQSAYSEPSCVCTPCECPGHCGRPTLQGKPKSHWMKVRWNAPENDGGGAVYQYELKLCKLDSRVESEEPTPSPSPERTLRGSSRLDVSQSQAQPPSENGDSPWLIGYKGPEQEAQVSGLIPGSRYRIKVRAFNAAGPGPWSEVLSTESGPGCPARVTSARIESISGGTVALGWDAPCNDGGAQITCYVVEHREGSMDMTDYALKSENYGFTEVSRGESTSFEMRGLSPNTTQNFRVAAANSVGLSSWSSVVTCCTPAAVPATLSAPQLVHVGHISAIVRWSPPATDGGARVEHYVIDVSTGKGATGLSFTKEMPDRQLATGEDSDDEDELDEEEKLSYVISPLEPETNYRVKVRAVNRVGSSAAGASLKLTTHCEPPPPPSLECSIVGHNFLKLVWRAEESGPRSPHKTAKDNGRDGRDHKFIQYSLEMVTSNGATLLYQGPVTSFKVVRLKENSNYAFRIRASNLDSEGDWSQLVSFSTCFAPPAAPPAPRVEKVFGEGEFIVDWAAATSLWKFAEPCQFLLELGEHQLTPNAAAGPGVGGGVVGMSAAGGAIAGGGTHGAGGDTTAAALTSPVGITTTTTERPLTWTEIYRGSEERTRISIASGGVFTGGADELRFVRLAQLRLVDVDTNIKSPYCQPVPLVGRPTRAKALPKTVRPQAVADLASAAGAQQQHHHHHHGGHGQHQQGGGHQTAQPQQLRRNSLQSAVVEPTRPPRAIGQWGDHHWAAIFVVGFALAAILVAFLLEKFVHVSS